MNQQPEAVENYKDLYNVTRKAWQRDHESLEILSREYSEAIDTLATAMQQLIATQEENQALKETIATNEQCAGLQLEAVTNDRAHLKALLDRATDERYELHNRLIETSARLNKELTQSREEANKYCEAWESAEYMLSITLAQLNEA